MKTTYIIGGLFFVGVVFYLMTRPSTVVAAGATNPSTSNALIGGIASLGTSLINSFGGKQSAPSASPYPSTSTTISYPSVGNNTGQNYSGPSYYGNTVVDENGAVSGSGVADGGT